MATMILRRSLLAAFLLGCSPPAWADDLRFLSLHPGGAAGEWTAVVSGRGVAKNPGALAFWADGQPVATEPAGTEGGPGPSEAQGGSHRGGADRGGDGKEKSAAVAVGVDAWPAADPGRDLRDLLPGNGPAPVEAAGAEHRDGGREDG